MGESDRLLTILTAERGLIRLVAPGARKHLSSLGGRSALFVINSLLVAQGKNLDKLTQAETIESYPGLSKDLGKLTVAQYLAEIVLCQAIDDHPQPDLFEALRSHLSQLEQVQPESALLCLLHATYHFLAIAGVAPEVYHCCLSRVAIAPDFDTNFSANFSASQRIGFSPAAGGIIQINAKSDSFAKPRPQKKATGVGTLDSPSQDSSSLSRVASPTGTYGGAIASMPLTPTDLHLLQQLPDPNFMTDLHQKFLLPPYDRSWRTLERIFRQYLLFHFDRPIRSASLLDACFP
jgi:DNA repair protein RecO (recombination protein O)